MYILTKFCCNRSVSIRIQLLVDPWCKGMSLYIDPFWGVMYQSDVMCEQLWTIVCDRMCDSKGQDLVWSVLWRLFCFGCDFIWASSWCMQSPVLEKDSVMWHICARLIYDAMCMAQFLSIVIDLLWCCDYVVLKGHVIDVIQLLLDISMWSIGFKLS